MKKTAQEDWLQEDEAVHQEYLAAMRRIDRSNQWTLVAYVLVFGFWLVLKLAREMG